jgi:phosphatidylserine/phosphatidylglycerophosphate/cardiolipin synthase-like enzyme
LRIGYFKPEKGTGEPVKSHLKLVVVDDKVTVLGSGNMDRASWFTSQELGVALLSKEVAENVRDCVAAALEDRMEWICE